MTAVLSELSTRLWAFVRSDPGSVRQLNRPGNWSTWQATRHEISGREMPLEPGPPGTERRSLRRRRSLAA